MTNKNLDFSFLIYLSERKRKANFLRNLILFSNSYYYLDFCLSLCGLGDGEICSIFEMIDFLDGDRDYMRIVLKIFYMIRSVDIF